MILENIDEIIFTLNPVAKGAALGFVSSRITDVLGYTPDEMIALGNSIIHPDDVEHVRQKTREAFLSSATTTFEYRIRHCNGSTDGSKIGCAASARKETTGRRSSASHAISPTGSKRNTSGAAARKTCSRRIRWKRSVGSPAASRTTSTIC